MILDVIICALWCIGILTLIWCIAGWLLLPLSSRQMTVLVPDDRPGALELQLRANEWLRAAGLLKGPVYVLRDDLEDEVLIEAEHFASEHEQIDILTRAQLCVILKVEQNHDETGRADDPRHSTERTVSKP